MSLPALSLRRPVGTIMVHVAVAALGLVVLPRLPLELLPDVAFPSLTVSTVYRGAGPAEVERFITSPIEEQLRRVRGIRSVTSISREGRSVVSLRFRWGADMEFASLHVRERLDRLAGRLPREAEDPVLLSADPADEPIVTLAVAGDDLFALRGLAEAVFERRLEQLEGVALAAASGGPRREIRVVVDPDRMRARSLRLDDVRRALDGANRRGAGGMVRRGRLRYSLRTLGAFADMEEIGQVPVGPGRGGSAVRLSEIAAVRDGFADRKTLARYDGRDAVVLQVYREAGSNAVRVGGRIRETVRRLRDEYRDVEISVVADRAVFVRDAVADVVQALLAGGLLAFVVLFLFLGDHRSPVAVGVAIPTSVLASLALCQASGVSLNVMSLGGLALGVGMLVDNSIVVLENISRHRDEEGASAARAALDGTAEVAGPVTASTLTTVAVFGPVLSVEGVAGALFGDLALAVAFSLLASLVVALTLLPVLARRSAEPPAGGESGRRPGRLPGRFGRWFRWFASRYEAALAWCLAHRVVVVSVAAALLAATLAVGSALPRRMSPPVDEGRFRVQLELPAGTPLADTDGTVRRLESVLDELPGVADVYARVGRSRGAELTGVGFSGLHRAVLEVSLEGNGPSVPEAVRRFRAAVRRAGVAPGAVSVSSGRASSLGRALGGEASDLDVEVSGAGSPGTLAVVAESVGARIRGLEALDEVRVDFQRAQPELTVEVLRDEAARHGLGAGDVAAALASFLRGVRTERPLTRFTETVPIRVSLPRSGRRRLAEVLEMPVSGVPLGHLVRVRRDRGPVEILREDGTRTVKVRAAVEGGLDRAVASVRDRLEGLELPPRVTVRVGGAGEEMRESFRSLIAAFGLALFLVYLLLAAQFESVVRPLVVLASVPLAAVGSVLLLWLSGGGFDVMSGIGLVVLVGVVVNDAIVKVDAIDRCRRSGRDKREAILEAGRQRLRPILMTTATTVLGLAPMALGWGAGAELRAPLAVAVIGGLLSATLLTLLVVPVIYSLVVDPGVPVSGPAAPEASP